MTFKANAPQMVAQDLSQVNAVQQLALGTNFSGSDPGLGFGEFAYVKGTGTINAGDWVEFTQSLAGGIVTMLVQQWQGGANSGKPLGVAVSTMTGNLFGWVQLFGNAIANSAAGVAAGDPAFFNTAGTTKSAATASKQVLNAQASTATNAVINGAAIGAAKTVYFLNYPVAQGQIT